MRVLTYNIRHGGHGRERQLAAVITQAAPDLAVLQEATDPAVVEDIARRAGMRACAARRGRSLAVMSRGDLGAHAWRRPRWMRRAVLDVEVATNTPLGPLRVLGVHLSAWHTSWTEHWRVRQLRSLLSFVTGQPGPHLVAGDFNSLAPGEHLDRAKLPPRLRALLWLSGAHIRWKTIDTMLEAHYVDTYRQLHPRDPGPTFPTWDPHLRLDYVFVDDRLVSRVAACEVISSAPASEASDHFPLLVVLSPS